ncbi:phage tail protein [Flavobacterium arcticum]|uniref:Phage tail protein n=1 Tax=Flavobacterium arcticum TaxID=1784713 RepID=A0A345HCR8_9FLAO|nr:GPW/gp25 family protein [Flavobacterium arcticum]AXG74378.1 phage tail protein [Flavobacterium arcticum]KAF2507507.1 GPW/gp25 family protein [Flavobacterium arcticum]
MGKQNDEIENHFLGVGWAFPVAFSAGNHKLELSWYENNVNDAINIILQTKLGERTMQPDFGSGMQQYFFRQMNATLKGQLEDAVKTALLEHEPRITVQSVTATYTDLLTGLVEIKVDYTYNQTNTRHNYVFPFYVKEGTNI